MAVRTGLSLIVDDKYKLNNLLDHKARKEYQINVANTFLALESLDISKTKMLLFKYIFFVF